MSDYISALEDLIGVPHDDEDNETAPPRGSLDGLPPSHDEPLAAASEPLTSGNLGDLTAQFAGLATESDGSQQTVVRADDDVPSLGTSLYSTGLVIPDAPSVASGEYAQPAAPETQSPYPFPEGEVYSEEYFREEEFRSARMWWTTDPTICPHLRIFGTCGDSDGDVPPEVFKRFGSEVCLEMWSRHRPCHAYTMVVANGRRSYQKDWWTRIGIEAKNYKPKGVCPFVDCGPCDRYMSKVLRYICRGVEDERVDHDYWDYHRYRIHGTPRLQNLERWFMPDYSEIAGKLCWFRFPYEVREIIYDLLLVNRHRFTQIEQNIQLADDQGPHHLYFSPTNLRAELGNTPWEWPCDKDRYDEIEHSPCAESQHYPCTGIWPAILRTSKAVLAEASWILYSRNTFEVSLSLEATGDPWYNLFGKRNERRQKGIESLGRIINRLYSYPHPEYLIPLIFPDEMDQPPEGEPESEHGLDLDNLSNASSEEEDFPVDHDPDKMPSWLTRIRLAAFLRKIGGRNASQIRTVYLTAFETDHVHAMLPIMTALFRQHMSRLTIVDFQLFKPAHGEETDASTSAADWDDDDDARDARNARLTQGWIDMYAQLAWLVERVGSLKELRYHGHYEFGACPTAQQVGWLIDELDDILVDRRNEAERMPQLEVSRWFLRRMLAYHRRGRRIGEGCEWYVGRRLVRWVDAQVQGGVEVLRDQLCLPYLTVEEMEEMEGVVVRAVVGESEGEAAEESEEVASEEEKEEVEVGVVEVAAAGAAEEEA